MEEKRITAVPDTEREPEPVEEKTNDEGNTKQDMEAQREAIKAQIEEIKRKNAEANEAMREGKGRLRLETPIKAGDKEIEELAYDFTSLTGLDYTEAMDSDMNANAQQVFKITYRQGLALFARAAAKHTEGVDMRDIIERIGVTDAVEGVQLATLFFGASTRAGHQRISKK